MGIHESVISYLKSGGCSPSLSGFKILSSVMEICLDNPEVSMSDLFDMYVVKENLPAAGRQAKVAMRAAKYCFAKSPASKSSTFEGFIRGFSSYFKGGTTGWEKAAGSYFS